MVLWAYATLHSATNASNNVKFYRASLSYELIRGHLGVWSWLHSLGVYGSVYNATSLAGATLPLNAVVTYAPTLEERFQIMSGPQTIFWFALQGYYPVFSSDADNGPSNSFISFGAELNGGMKMDLSRAWSVETGIRGRGMSIQVASTGSSIIETQYGFFIKLLRLF